MTTRHRFLTLFVATLAVVGVIALGPAAPPSGKGKNKPTLTVTIDPTSISESGGTAEGTVTRTNADTASDLTVALSSSDTTEAAVQISVTISGGSDFAIFPIDAVNDSDIDGDQTVTITATATGYRSGSATLTVADDESPPTATEPSFTMTLLGTLGGASSEAWAMNENGDVVGTWQTAIGPYAPWASFVYFSDTQQMVDLRTLLPQAVFETWVKDSFVAIDINSGINNGPKQICGRAQKLNGSGVLQTYAIRITLPHQGDAAIVETVGGLVGSVQSWASDINKFGDVTGTYVLPGGINRTFAYYEGIGSLDIGDLGGEGGRGWVINNLGEITGYSENADRERRAFLFIPGEAMQDLGIIKKVRRIDAFGSYSYGEDINDSAVVVGVSVAGLQNGSPIYRAFLEAGNGMVNLGTLDGDSESNPTGINSHNEVVGESFVGSSYRGFLYSSSFGMLELNALIDGLPVNYRNISVSPLKINDSGTISGSIRLEDFTTQAFVLMPNP
jgi:probable HAF family extracellular repeat protein